MLKKNSFFFIIFLISCSNPIEPEQILEEPINFNSPKTGQVSTYQQAFGENYIDKSNSIYELSNTFLDVKISNIVKDTIFITETIKNSPQLSYAIYFRNDSLNIFKPNSMFLDSYLFGSHFINYKIPFITDNKNQIDFLEWKTSTRFCECFLHGYSKNYSTANKRYDSLSVVVDETEMARDKSGYNFLFSLEDGIILSTKIIPWKNAGDIWMLVSTN